MKTFMKTIIKKLLCIVLVLWGTGSAFAINVGGKAPVFVGTDPIVDGLVDQLNADIGEGFRAALKKIKVEGIDFFPKQFIESWGNSGVFGSHGATERAYGEYKLFSITTGAMLGLQLPSDPFSINDELGKTTDKLVKEHDIKLGVSPQLFNARIGINTSGFLAKGLYLGLHIGFFNLDNSLFPDFSFNTFSIGPTVNYQLVPQKSLAAGVLLWRGLNLGSGIIYQGTTIDYAKKLGKVEQAITLTPEVGNMKVTIEPEITFDIKADTVVIPLEVTTAVRLLYFLNIPLGLGVDLGFGKSELKIGMDGKISIDGYNNSLIKQKTPGNLYVNAGGDTPPSFFNLKLITGVGLTIGPIVLDVPVTFYIGEGYNIGLTLGLIL